MGRALADSPRQRSVSAKALGSEELSGLPYLLIHIPLTGCAVIIHGVLPPVASGLISHLRNEIRIVLFSWGFRED